MDLLLIDADSLEFTLVGASEIPLGVADPVTYSPTTEILHVPLVEVMVGDSPIRYAIDLGLVDGAEETRFRLLNAQEL